MINEDSQQDEAHSLQINHYPSIKKHQIKS